MFCFFYYNFFYKHKFKIYLLTFLFNFLLISNVYLTNKYIWYLLNHYSIPVSDITGGRAKLLVTILFELFWSIGLILLPAVSIFLSDWTNLYHVLSLPTLILVFLHRQVKSCYQHEYIY